jgi:hypothetical protein
MVRTGRCGPCFRNAANAGTPAIADACTLANRERVPACSDRASTPEHTHAAGDRALKSGDGAQNHSYPTLGCARSSSTDDRGNVQKHAHLNPKSLGLMNISVQKFARIDKNQWGQRPRNGCCPVLAGRTQPPLKSGCLPQWLTRSVPACAAYSPTSDRQCRSHAASKEPKGRASGSLARHAGLGWPNSGSVPLIRRLPATAFQLQRTVEGDAIGGQTKIV